MNAPMKKTASIGILILAGGQGSRMGGRDKGWVKIGDQAFVEQLLSGLKAQISTLDIDPYIVISANRNLQRYKALADWVISDQRSGYQGPLAGIESALATEPLQHVQRWIVCPVDTPILPEDYLASMLSLEADELGYLVHNQRHHYTHLSLPSSFKAELVEYLDAGRRSMKGLLFDREKVKPVLTQNQGFVLENINSLDHCLSNRLPKFA